METKKGCNVVGGVYIGFFVSAIFWALLLFTLSGCAVPALLGVKSYKSGDTQIDFITGVDFGFGMNGVDKVNDTRGISPTGK